MSLFFDMLKAALYTIFIQNLVFSGGYGASEVIRMSSKPHRFVSFSVMIAYFSTVTAVICYGLDRSNAINSMSAPVHTLLVSGVLLAVYIITALVVLAVFHPKGGALNTLGIAALNTLVLAIPLINRRAASGFAESVGTGLGSGLAFVIAVFLINAGLKKLESSESAIPAAFRGTPALFLYVAMLSLALTGLSSTGIM